LLAERPLVVAAIGLQPPPTAEIVPACDDGLVADTSRTQDLIPPS
jgi:hypothetical protein